MNKPVIYVEDLFKDKIELADRAFLASEILYFLINFDETPKDEAMEQVMEMTDESLVDNINGYCEGSGTIYQMKK